MESSYNVNKYMNCICKLHEKAALEELNYSRQTFWCTMDLSVLYGVNF